MTSSKSSLKSAEKKLRAFALDYPDAVEEFPWGHSAFKVNKKVFLFLATEKGELSMSMKLPKSGKAALKNSFASPTEYGMGKHGWVTSRFAPGDSVPLDLLTDWIDESFRAIAPKKIVAFLDDEDTETLPIIRKRKPATSTKR
ncbi:MAG: MmcQ/YjbR family DNA-binding protein [Anaerolineae bacterium]|nr:MmcQ/YjbR family DNA-binding protein [Phycisphaerae bacterium]